MRFLLLSVLVVFLVGIMVPSAFAKVYEIIIEDPATPANDPLSRNCGGQDCLYPEYLTVGVGDQVRFVNADDVDHDINSGTVAGGLDCNANGCSRVGGFSSGGLIYVGESYITPVFTEEGEYRYFSQLRPWVKGLIIVEAVSPPEPVTGTIDVNLSPSYWMDEDGNLTELTEEEYCLRHPKHVKCTLTEKEIEGLEKPEYTPTYEITKNMTAYVNHYGEWNDWRHTTKPLYNELVMSRGLEPTDFSGFIEYSWNGYIKNYGTKTWESGARTENVDLVDLFIYRFDSYYNAQQFFKSHTDYWQIDRGKYENEVIVGSTDLMISNDKIGESIVPADKCMSQNSSSYSALTDVRINKNALYCMKNEIVIFTTAMSYGRDKSAVLAGFMDNAIDTISIHQSGGYHARSDNLLPNNPQYASLTPAVIPINTTSIATTQKSSGTVVVTEAVPEQTAKETLSFFDPDKGVKHYVERYTTEPDYKAWFDRNFPDYTIWKGIGITESQYQKIVNDLTKPQPVAEQKVAVQTSSGGNEIIYVLVAAVAIGGGIGAIFFMKKGSKSSTTVRRESPSRRQTTVLFCGKCGVTLKPDARFCGKCGNPQS